MQRISRQTIEFKNKPSIISSASVAGKLEGMGPLGKYFDVIIPDDRWNCKTWEECESKIQSQALSVAMSKAKLINRDIDTIVGGDLINQCTSTTYAHASSHIPFLGVYGACSTMIESTIIGSILIDGGYSSTASCITSSHFCSAERQFRSPLEYGGQRPQSSQQTVTGSGCIILKANSSDLVITHATIGEIMDFGISDANNMGAAMAPAACSVISSHLRDTKSNVSDYDLILTGDLGKVGSDILKKILLNEGYNINNIHNDCGLMIFNRDTQDVHAGGSGCGCCGSVLCGYALSQLKHNNYKKIMVCATGALMSPVMLNQGKTIPAISHAITIEKL